MIDPKTGQKRRARITDICIDFVSDVKEGANEYAKVKLLKAKKEEETPMTEPQKTGTASEKPQEIAKTTGKVEKQLDVPGGGGY